MRKKALLTIFVFTSYCSSDGFSMIDVVVLSILAVSAVGALLCRKADDTGRIGRNHDPGIGGIHFESGNSCAAQTEEKKTEHSFLHCPNSLIPLFRHQHHGAPDTALTADITDFDDQIL